MPQTRHENLSFHDRAPVQFTASHTLRATPAQVFEALADTPSWQRWFPAVTASKWTSEAPFGVGSTRQVKVGPMAIDEEFTVWEPGKQWGFTVTNTTLPMARAVAEVMEIEPIDDGAACTVTHRMSMEPLRGMGMLSRLMARGIESGMAGGLRGLDRHLANAL
ncbi:MAG: hypothetical protein ACI867_002111 [Glaciecola sp.]|jgi:uncharacterized protein YndB with AHSA1/START domain